MLTCSFCFLLIKPGTKRSCQGQSEYESDGSQKSQELDDDYCIRFCLSLVNW